MAGMGRVQIGTVMRRLLSEDQGEIRDSQTGEVNCTRLAELAAAEFGIEGEPPDRFFEIAFEFEQSGPNETIRNLINSLDSSWF